MIEIKELKQTCSACPSQWEGFLTDGRAIYIRLRHGWLSIQVSENPTTNTMDAVGGKQIYGSNDVEYDGVISYEDLKKHATDIIKWCERESEVISIIEF